MDRGRFLLDKEEEKEEEVPMVVPVVDVPAVLGRLPTLPLTPSLTPSLTPPLTVHVPCFLRF